MAPTSWLWSWLRRPARRTASAVRLVKPWLEPLEQRQLLDAGPLPNGPGGLQGSFIAGLYHDLLNRAPGSDELSSWLSAANNQTTPAEVADIVAGSAEYDANQVQAVYTSLLGRAASAQEVQAWLPALESGLDARQMTAVVLSSDEFYNDHGATPAGWLGAVFGTQLGRAPDAVALAAWGSVGPDPMGRLVVAQDVMNSIEGRDDTVAGVYEQLLHHGPDSDSLYLWVSALGGGSTEAQLVASVASSPEYQALQAATFSPPPTMIPQTPPVPHHRSGGSGGGGGGTGSTGTSLPSASLPIVPGSWTLVGPAPVANGQVAGANPVSGRVTGIAADPTNANIIYLAAAGGGAWKTTDGGQTWIPLTDNQQTLFMGAIAIAPSNGNVIYAGTGEANNSGDSYYGRGVLKSTDGGATWTLETANGQFDRRTISRIAVDPTNANIVYVAVCDEGANGLTGNTGIWKSTDGGATWTNTTTGISGITNTDDFSDVLIDPKNSKILFCAVGTPGGGAANGVYESTDSGTTWAASGNFTIGTANGWTKVAMAPSNDQVLYATVADPTSQGILNVFQSTDGGTTWNAVTLPPNYLGGQGSYDSTVIVDPNNSNTVYLGGSTDGTTDAAGNFLNQVLESTDGGSTWNDISNNANGADGVHADHHAMAFDANGKLLDGNDGGIWRLDNATPGSISWTDINGNLSTLQFVGIGLAQNDPSTAYGGTQDNGTLKFTGTLPWDHIQFGDGGFVRVDPTNPNTVYHTFFRIGGVDGDSFIERSTDGGATWTTITNGLGPNDPSEFYPPYVMDPTNPARLILGTDHVYETTDQGNNWTAIGTPNQNGFNPNGDVVSAVAISKSSPNTIYVATSGSDGAFVWVTTNDGGSWTQSTIPGVTDHLSYLQVDPTNSQIVYATRDGFDSSAGTGQVFRSADGGGTWTNITNNLPNLPAYTVVVDQPDNAVFVGNDTGVFVSTNAGQSWSVFGTGLPNAQVHELDFSPTLQILAAGTHGRSMWEISTASISGGGGGGPTLPVIPVPGGDVTGLVKILYPFRYTYDPTTNTFNGDLTIYNPQTKPLFGPALTLAFPDLPPGVTVVNATAQLVTGPRAIVLPEAVLGAGQSFRVKIQLSDPESLPLSTFYIGFHVEVFVG